MAEQTIDKLQVEVQASAKGTSAVFQQLERNLEILQKSLNAIDTSRLQNVQKATSGTRVGINTSGMQKAEKEVAASVAKIQQSIAGLNAYANAAMGGDKSAFHSYERGAMRVQSAIDVLSAKISQLGNTRIDTKEWTDLQKNMEDTKSALDAFEKKRQEMTDTGPEQKNHEEYVELLHAIRDCTFEYDKLKAKQDELVNTGKDSTDPFAPYRESLEKTKNQLNETMSTVRTTMEGMNQTPSPKIDNSGLTETKEKAIDASKALKKLYDGTVGKALSSLKSALKKIGSALTGIGKNADGAFGKGFMKILKYGFGIRSLYVLFRRLRKAVTESFKELQNSGAFYQETKANIDELKQSLAVLKYQFGAAFEPIFNAVAPALKVLVNNLIKVMNVISAFMAKLTGRSTYSKAVLNAAAFADNTGKAAKAQKELNKQLQGFDELNNLTTNKSNPGSGSSGSNDDIPGATYVEEQVDSVLGDFGKELAEKIRSGDWKGVGQAISDKLSEAMEKINWDAVYQKAKDFGSGLANFLNGLINPRLFGNLASTLAGALNSALYFLNSFGTTFDWKNFGNSIAQGINKFLKTFDFAELGKTIHTWIGGLLDAGIELLEQTDFELLGEKLGEFIANLDIPDLAKKLGKLALLIIKALGEAILGLLSNKEALEGLGSALLVILGAVTFKGLLGVLGTAIANAIAGQTIAVTASGTTIALSGVLLTIGGVALWNAAEAGNQVSGNPMITNDINDWGLKAKETTLGATGLAAIGAIPTMMQTVATEGLKGFFPGLAKGFAKAFPTAAAVSIGSVGGNMIGNSFGAYATMDDPTMQKYYEKYRDIGNIFHPIKNITAAWDIAEGAKSGNLTKGTLMAYHDLLESGAIDPDDITGVKTVVDNFIADYFDAMNAEVNSSGMMLFKTAAKKETKNLTSNTASLIANLASKAKPLAKTSKSYLDLFLASANYSGSDSTSGLNGGLLDGFDSSMSKSTMTLGEFTSKVSDALKGVTSLANETDTLGQKSAATTTTMQQKFSAVVGVVSQAVNTTAANIDKGFNGMPSTLTKYANQSWKGVTDAFATSGKWSSDTSETISKGFNGMPSTIENKFKSAYSKGTGAWTGIDGWANGVTTRTSQGMNGMPTDIQKKFADAYSKGTGEWKNLDKWSTDSANVVSNAYVNFPSATSKQFGDAYSQGTSKWSGLPSWASKIFATVSSASNTNLGKIPGQFSTNFGNGTSNAQGKLTSFQTWLSSLNLVKKAGVEADEPSFTSFKSKMNSFMSELKNNKKVSISVEGTGFSTIISNFNLLLSKINQIKSSSSSVGLGLSTGLKTFRYMASGGVVGGATPAIVGEAGPEAVIPLTDGTIGKLADMIVGDMAVPNAPAINGSSGYNSYGSNPSDISVQNELLREEVALLRQIANKELTVSSKDVFNATRSESENYYNRTGNSPFLF